jgi:hypothetical protein
MNPVVQGGGVGALLSISTAIAHTALTQAEELRAVKKALDEIWNKLLQIF